MFDFEIKKKPPKIGVFLYAFRKIRIYKLIPHCVEYDYLKVHPD